MGCDIHCHFEIKIEDKWEHYSSPDISRNYALFAKMANVRNSSNNPITPISEPKGLPEDISGITKINYKRWEGDAHSVSWLNSDEIKEMIDYHKELFELYKFKYSDEWGYLFGSKLHHFKEYRKNLPKEIQDIRLVFWFDN